MKVSELVALLQLMPQEPEVMRPCESNLDHALRVGIVQVANTDCDWSGTPMGNYRVIDGDDTAVKTGENRSRLSSLSWRNHYDYAE